ncbi:MAG TPA: multiheme c-type cytochrome [Bryobacteraceae bacterium]|nr:multiheme c-type cytochrome [Bryobacteraceae bacterium]
MALMAVAATTTMNAQTLQAPRLALRAVTPGDISTYKLPSTTQVSGGLSTVGLGEPLYMEVQVDITLPASQLGGVTWAISESPSGSKAALAASPLGTIPIKEPSDALIYQVAGRQMFIPDIHGLYVISATVTINGTATQLYQSYIAGTYVGVAVCTQCHGGGLAQPMVAPWSQTAHASIFTNIINGTVAGENESASCAACHTVGYDAHSTVNDGGFSYTASQLKWTFPTTDAAGDFQAMPQALQNLANIQCENCHGPGSEHAYYGGDVIAVAIPTNTGGCNQCHDAPTHHYKGTTWALSMHAVTTTDPAGNASCVGCHTGTGFIARMNGENPITDTSYHSIDCSACHEPHGMTQPSSDSHLIRNMASVTLADGTKVTSSVVGEGILCMQCHQSRLKASAVDTTTGSAHFGPHEGPQADMLMGTNGYTYGKTITSSAHQYVTTNACIDCHMQTVASTDPAFMKAGDHTFSTTYAPAGQAPEDLVGACQACHGTDLTSFNFPIFNFSGGSGFAGVQDQVQSLLDQLSTMLPPNSLVKSSLTIDSTWTKPQLEAAYNWLFVNNDGSKGIHNLDYAVGLLQASIANLQGQK